MDFPERPRRPPSEPLGRLLAEEGEPEPPLPEDAGAPQPSRVHPRRGARDRGPQRRGPGETIARIVVAIPWIIFIVAVIAAGDLIFALAASALAMVGIVELFRMVPRARPFPLVGIGAVVAMCMAAHFGDSFQMVLVGVAFFPVMFAFAASRESRRNVTWAMAITVFGIIWIGLPFAHAVLLRDLDPHGGALLIDVLVATFVTDTASYFGGRMFGRRPLAPSLSPSKTVEGLIIGIVAGTLGFWFAGLYQDWLSGFDALVMGATVAALAPVGDLFASMIKRDLEIKDTGRLFGPHGGLLDRVDAALFTLVAGYYLAVAYGF